MGVFRVSRAVNAVMIVAVVVGFVVVTGLFLREGVEKRITIEIPQAVDWNLDGFSLAEVKVIGNSIILSSDCRELSILTNDQQAQAVSMGLHKKIGKRPLTHDLMADSLDFFEVDVIMAKVTTLNDGTYYARLIMREGNDVLEIDSRPSDAITIATRSNAPVYVSDQLFEEHGDMTC